MEEKANVPFWKPALIYGAIVGVVGIVISLVFYFLNVMTAGWVSWVSILISIAILAYCLVAYRNEHLGGFASFGQLFVMGLVIGIVASILSAAYTYILYTYIDPDLVEKIKVAAEEKIMNNSRIPESMYDSIFEKMEKRMSVSRMTVMALIAGPIVNGILSLIIAAFVKREQNPVGNSV